MTLIQIASDIIAAAILLCGASGEEDLDSDELERYQTLSRHPVCINTAPRSRLLASGLFSPYQSASLLDYRSTYGDILSEAELAGIDGFSQETAEALKLFVDFTSYAAIGESSSARSPLEVDSQMKMTFKDTGTSFSIKADVERQGKWEVTGAVASPLNYGFSASLDLGSSRLMAGDYNCRFGQGLLLWNGFSLSGFSGANSFFKNPTGISRYNGLAGTSFRGIAYNFLKARFFLNAACCVKNKLGVLNAGYLWKSGQASATALWGLSGAAAASCDFRLGKGAMDYCGEFSFDIRNKCFAATASIAAKLSDNLKLSLNVHHYPDGYDASLSGASRSGTSCKNESGAALAAAVSAGSWLKLPSGSSRRLTASLAAEACLNERSKDASVAHSAQLKSMFTGKYCFNEFLSSSTKASVRLRNYGEMKKFDIKQDFAFDNGRLYSMVKFEYQNCTGYSWLMSSEQGYKSEKISLYLKESLFKVDLWDDRIYSYERDAPGNFSVNVFYGRGMNFSGVLSIRTGSWGKLYLKASGTVFPHSWQPEDKPFKYQLRVQFNVSLRGKSKVSDRPSKGRS